MRVATSQFSRVSYTEAIEILQEAVKAGQKFEYPVEWGFDLQTEHERYLTERQTKIESFSGSVKPLDILYVDHERIVFGSFDENFQLSCGAEYALKLSFSLHEGPVASRDVFATCAPAKVYSAEAGGRTCADCVYTSLQEEDRRFIYEKATKNLCA